MFDKKLILNEDNFKEISSSLKEFKSIAFKLEVDSMYSISLMLSLGVKELTFLDGISSEEGNFIFVSIIKRGCFRFSINSDFHPSYVEEKLNLGRDEALSVSYMLRNICSLLK